MLRRSLLAGGLAAPVAGLGLPALGQAPARPSPATPPTVEELLRLPEILSAAVSPNGRKIALLKRIPDGERDMNRERRIDRDNGRQREDRNTVDKKWMAFVSLLDIGDLEKPTNIPLGDIAVERIVWKADDRLLIWLRLQGLAGLPVRVLGSMGGDGSEFKILLQDKAPLVRLNLDMGDVIDLLPNDPRHILMRLNDPERFTVTLQKVDIYSGQLSVVELGTQFTDSWQTRDGVAVTRTDVAGKVATLFARAPGETAWKEVRKFYRTELVKADFEVVTTDTEPGVVLVAATPEGATTRSLYRFDLKTMTYGARVSSHPRFDLEDCIVDHGGRYLAGVYREDRLGYDFADPSMAGHFRELDEAFNRDANIDLIDSSLDHGVVIAKVSAPRNGGAYIVFDRAKAALGFLGEAYPWLPEAKLAPTAKLNIKTRDGQTIRAYLTLPLNAASGPRPLVVMPHGGPAARDNYDYNPLTQVLAAQGWMVLQPNFRGSSGYGRAHEHAGDEQWNGRMMADIEDSIDEVLATGRVDRERIAIFGASFGGYAALMCGIRRPDLYKAVVSFAGVSDLIDMLAEERKEGVASESYKYWLRNIGDPGRIYDQIAAACPARRAEEMKAPVLLIHGDRDGIVPSEQSQAMNRALRRARKSVEYMEIEFMGHGFDINNIDRVVTKIVDFLKTNLA